jgi:hypothetical protein
MPNDIEELMRCSLPANASLTPVEYNDLTRPADFEGRIIGLIDVAIKKAEELARRKG